MPAPLRIKLNLQEEETLTELRKAISVPYRTRDRAHMLKLNAQGRNVRLYCTNIQLSLTYSQSNNKTLADSFVTT